ncbi:hypothetical protein EOPP23_07460 [Endozoicomonas sp. OPT23]|uniref:TraB/GumN family protein n=1 Tax=Endozoicomonas sp. OPT23 TaxID=2072845 RepID=UPI00129B2F5B|nr:TraB/GumN family protein [Endozoicomonas sp. OPT23]MRI32820.1 hypothetical protein [Endozoicomonas sp. OPT23]
MKRTISSLSTCLCLFILSLNVGFTAASEDFKTKLWEISDGTSVKGYLLGTYPTPDLNIPGLDEVLNHKVDRLFTDYTQMSEGEVESFFFGVWDTHGSIASDQHLVDRLNKGLGYVVASPDVKLWTLWLELELKLNGAWGDNFQSQLIKKAVASRLDLQTLEHHSAMVERLDSLLAGLSAIKQKALFHELLNQKEKQDKGQLSVNELVRRYQDGSYAREYHTPNHVLYGPVISKIFSAANGKWLDRMAGELESGRVLFALDVRHLNGDMGLVKLLRNKGYQVYPYGQKPAATQISQEFRVDGSFGEIFLAACLAAESVLTESGYINSGKCQAMHSNPWTTVTLIAIPLVITLASCAHVAQPYNAGRGGYQRRIGRVYTLDNYR